MLGTLSSVVILSVVHIVANRIAYFGSLPRRKLLSLAGGISVAFVFTHILPQLHEMQDLLEQNGSIPLPVESYLYVMALVGIIFFYGIEKAIIRLRELNASKEEIQIDDSIFWWHIGIFGSFNFVIGYYLHHELRVSDVGSFLTILALGFHFLVNDYALLQHHEDTYRKRGRWIMAGAVVAGWGVGTLYALPRNLSFTLFALVAGAIIVNSFKEEFPDEKENHFGYFLAGTLVYAALISIDADTDGN